MKTCPSCGAATMARDLPYTYKGETTTLPAVMGNFCMTCHESILDAPQSRRSHGIDAGVYPIWLFLCQIR